MKTQMQNPKVLAGAATVMFLLSMITAGIFYSNNETLSDLLNNEKALTERLASEKEQLMRDIDGFKGDIGKMKERNQQLDGLLADATGKLSQKEIALANMGKENKNIKKQLNDLQQIRENMNAEMETLKNTIQLLESENHKLAEANAGLKAEIQDLKDKLKTSMVKANNFRVEVLRKKKDRLTVSARRTHVLTVTFDHNLSAMAFMGDQKVFMVVKSPEGVILTTDNTGKTKLMFDGASKEIQYSTVQSVKQDGASTLTFRFEPEEELKAGVYKVDVYTESAYLGSNQFRLVK